MSDKFVWKGTDVKFEKETPDATAKKKPNKKRNKKPVQKGKKK